MQLRFRIVRQAVLWLRNFERLLRRYTGARVQRKLFSEERAEWRIVNQIWQLGRYSHRKLHNQPSSQESHLPSNLHSNDHYGGVDWRFGQNDFGWQLCEKRWTNSESERRLRDKLRRVPRPRCWQDDRNERKLAAHRDNGQLHQQVAPNYQLRAPRRRVHEQRAKAEVLSRNASCSSKNGKVICDWMILYIKM